MCCACGDRHSVFVIQCERPVRKRPSLTVRNWVGEAEGHGGADIRVPLHHRVGVEGPIDNRCSIGSGPFQHVFHFVIE